jgi:hypothetical protein
MSNRKTNDRALKAPLSIFCSPNIDRHPVRGTAGRSGDELFLPVSASCHLGGGGVGNLSAAKQFAMLRRQGGFAYTRVSSTTTKVVVSTMESIERRYLSVTKTRSLMLSGFLRKSLILNLHDADVRLSWLIYACSPAGLNSVSFSERPGLACWYARLLPGQFQTKSVRYS